MTYFRELPDIQYQSPLSNRVSSNEYVTVKNLFRRVKLRDDLKGSTTYLQNYSLKSCNLIFDNLNNKNKMSEDSIIFHLSSVGELFDPFFHKKVSLIS